MSSASSPSTAFLNSGLAPGVERFLIDDEDEAAAGVDAGVGAVRRRHARRCAGASACSGRGRDAPQRAHRPDAVADPDFDFSRLEIRDRRAVGLDGDEIDGRAGGAFARDRRLLGPTRGDAELAAIASIERIAADAR